MRDHHLFEVAVDLGEPFLPAARHALERRSEQLADQDVGRHDHEQRKGVRRLGREQRLSRLAQTRLVREQEGPVTGRSRGDQDDRRERPEKSPNVFNLGYTPEIAGVAMQTSPNGLVATRSRVVPALMTWTWPSSLVK